MRIRFHQSLDDLKEKLLVMAGMAEQAIQRAIEAYRTRDTSICDLVMHGELAINKLEREIDQMALDLLAMEQPMAIDLRFILAVIKINADLERVGDQAVNIAERVCDLNDKMNEAAYYSLSILIKEQPALTAQALNALVISRNLERVADHATNIAEDVIFWVRGADVRHHQGDAQSAAS